MLNMDTSRHALLRLAALVLTIAGVVQGYSEYITNNRRIYTQVLDDLPLNGELTFDLQGEKDALLVLAADLTDTDKFFGVSLGSQPRRRRVISDEQKSCILQPGSNRCTTANFEETILSATEFRSFWISWKDGKLQVGKGCTVNEEFMMEFQYSSGAFPDAGPIKAWVKTKSTSLTWRFGDGACSDNIGSGALKYFNQVDGLTVTTPQVGNRPVVAFRVDPDNRIMMKFEVTASNNAYVLLWQDINNPKDNFYTISYSVGRDKNRICLTKNGGGFDECLDERLYWEFLDSTEPKELWVTFNGESGAVEVGKGDTYGTHYRQRILNYVDENPLKITTVGFHSAANTATWTINNVAIVSEPEPTVCPPSVSPPTGAPHLWTDLVAVSKNDVNLDWVIDGEAFLLTASSTVNSIVITNNGKLVFDETDIILSTRDISIRDGGELWIGSESHPHQSKAEIVLRGKSNDPEVNDKGGCGRKFICVLSGGTLEMHGKGGLSWTTLTKTLDQGDAEIKLTEPVPSWVAGDVIVIATTDDDMSHTEAFKLVDCPACDDYTRKLNQSALHMHYGEFYEGVDMRAEVARLSRNIVIRGEMESSNYGETLFPNFIGLFDHDIFGGHTIFHRGFTNGHISNVEFREMGHQLKGRYPVHFHLCDDVDQVGCYDNPAWVRNVSIHHSFDRCVTIHGTDGLEVSNTVGYNVMGHCFFEEDGGEQRNLVKRNLGLSTKYGFLEPSDRSPEYCTTVNPLANTANCDALSTFWLTNPNNRIIDNVAVGSEGVGFWYIFRDAPSGPSTGKLPPGVIGTTPILEFRGNKAVAHRTGGLFIDSEVITSPSTAELETLSVKKVFPYRPTDVSYVREFTASHCKFGGWTRGGNITMEDCRYADNMYGHQTLSYIDLTPEGENQKIRNSVFVGKSPNNPRRGKVEGVRILQGPVSIEDTAFINFLTHPRGTVIKAISLRGGTSENSVQASTLTQVSGLTFTNVDPGTRIGFQESVEQMAVVKDDGSLAGTGTPSYVVSDANQLNHDQNCVDHENYGIKACPGKHASLYVQAFSPATGATLTSGSNSVTVDRRTNMIFNLQLERTYDLTWTGDTPNDITLRMVNFDQGHSVTVAVSLCRAVGATFDIQYETEQGSFPLTPSATLQDFTSGNGDTYYSTDSLLYVKLKAKLQRWDWWYYPEGYGTEQIHIKPSVTNGFIAC